MKRWLPISLFSLLLIPLCTAQPNKKVKVDFLHHHSTDSRSVQSFIYTLSTFTDTYTDLTGATSLNNGEIWDDPEYSMPMAFPFVINGNDVTELSFYGVGSLMRAPTSDPLVDNYVFSFESDLVDRGSFGSTSLSPISYKVEGPVGNRIQKVEFKNAGSYYEMDEAGTLNMFVNVQMWLYEGSNTIEFHYGPSFINDPGLFYGGDSGPGVGATDFDETNEIITNPHFIAGAAANPFLTANLVALSGTPAEGMVYRLYINVPIELTVTGVNATSFCNPNGSATATVTGGTEPYSYLWNTGATTQIINNLDAGTYHVTVTDDNGNTATGSIIISNVSPLDLIVITTDETGVGANDGTAEAQVSGGQPPYGYEWNTGATTALIENLPPGLYYITVTDASGCTAEESASINAFGCPELSLEVSVTNISCFGACDGLLSVLDVVPGTAPFTYNWNTGSTTSAIQNLCAGEYGVTVVDANGCIVLGNYVVTQPAELITSAGSTNESLQNQNDGTAWATPSGGTPPYSYAWSNGSTDSLIINLAPGTYSVTVTDDHSCTATQEVTIQSGPCGIIESQINHATCFEDCDGSIVLAFINNFPPITYVWSTGDDTSLITDLCAGEYTVTVSDNNGCVIVDSFNVQAPAAIFGNGGSTDETSNFNDGTAWVDPFGGTPPYTYLWDNGSTDSLIVSLPPDEYFVTITDAHGCEVVESFIVDPFSCLSELGIGTLSGGCFGSCNGVIEITSIVGIGPFSYLWNTGDTTDNLINLCAGHYELTITDHGNNCSESHSFDLLVQDSMYVIVDEIMPLTDTTASAINITPFGGIPPYSYFWSGPNGYTSSEEDLANIPPGFYSLVYYDSYGCESQIDSIEVLDHTTGISPIPGWNLQVYPNPANDKVYIKGVDAGEYQIQLISADGHIWKSWKNELTLDVHDVVPGLYILKFISGRNALTKPLLILR